MTGLALFFALWATLIPALWVSYDLPKFKMPERWLWNDGHMGNGL